MRPPRYVEYVSGALPVPFTSLTNAFVPPGNTERMDCNGLATGKSVDEVLPVTNAFGGFAPSRAIAYPVSPIDPNDAPVPPRNVEYTRAVKSALSFVTKASVQADLPGGVPQALGPNIAFCVGNGVLVPVVSVEEV